MDIITSHKPPAQLKPAPQNAPAAPVAPGEEKATTYGGAISDFYTGQLENWREFTLNEAAVEVPQTLLDMSNMRTSMPGTFTVAQLGISTLAATRALQGFRGETFEQKLEGTSSLALAAAGVALMFPGAIAANIGQGLLAVQGSIDFTLGARELKEEFGKNKPAWKEVSTGGLDIIKGAASFAPIFFPEVGQIANSVQLTALIAKTVLETSIKREATPVHPHPAVPATTEAGPADVRPSEIKN